MKPAVTLHQHLLGQTSWGHWDWTAMWGMWRKFLYTLVLCAVGYVVVMVLGQSGVIKAENPFDCIISKNSARKLVEEALTQKPPERARQVAWWDRDLHREDAGLRPMQVTA